MKPNIKHLILLTVLCFCGTIPAAERVLFQDPLTQSKEWRTEKGITFTPEGLRVRITGESEQSKLAAKAMANRDLLAACRSEIFGFGKSMSIPIDA